MIIDCHCHAGKGDLLTGPWDTDAPIETYLKRAKVAGIEKTVIFSPFHSNYRQANANTARIVEHYSGRFIGFAFVHAKRDRGRIYQIVEESVVKWRFRGIKVHRMDGAVTREVCEVARQFHLPLLYDPVGETNLIDLLAPQYPDVNFIIPHLGSFADDWRAHLRVIDQISRYPNVYTDTSGVRRFDYLIQAIKRGGAHKVLFGTDGPWLHPGVELHKIRLLGLPPNREELVLGKNLLRLIGQKRSPNQVELIRDRCFPLHR
ncbi:amidohydrolase [Scytonema hofmannii PCC 7110]|uniref:Amidohydrolase n=1 Tax=Scytonema hofmannii PCC 7110 TaxID=128403 RepID=A0A139WT44_9CYAN|nr:amidohydrolase family protein [Scytonema hofmannii]KYC35599.1 amidohydrolase [Scytonema hofmannii PCC 7110]